MSKVMQNMFVEFGLESCVRYPRIEFVGARKVRLSEYHAIFSSQTCKLNQECSKFTCRIANFSP